MDVPADTPVRVPVVPPETMVATPVLTLLHVPPLVPSLSIVVEPWHTLAVPVIAAGNGFTVTVTDRVHPAAVV